MLDLKPLTEILLVSTNPKSRIFGRVERYDSTYKAMSEYVLKIDDEPQAKTLLTYLRSLDFVELLPTQPFPQSKLEAIDGMKSFLATLPDREDYTQEEVNQAMHEMRSNKYIV